MNLKDKKVLGVPVVIVIVLVIASATIVSAALLNVYVSSSGTAEMKQGITWADGSTGDKMWEVSEDTGDTVTKTFSLETGSESAAPIEVSSTVEDEDGYTITNGVTVTHALVTTPFAKGDASASWNNAENAIALQVNDYNTPAVTLVPVEVGVGNTFSVDVDSTDDKASGQLMIDMDPENEDSNWAQVYYSNAMSNYYLSIYEMEGEFVYEGYHNVDGVEDQLVDSGEYANNNATIVGVKAQLYEWSGTETGDLSSSVTDTVNSITFDGTTYDLIKDDRTSVDTDVFTMPPLPAEEFDFNVTFETEPDLEPDNYTITTAVSPINL